VPAKNQSKVLLNLTLQKSERAWINDLKKRHVMSCEFYENQFLFPRTTSSSRLLSCIYLNANYAFAIHSAVLTILIFFFLSFFLLFAVVCHRASQQTFQDHSAKPKRFSTLSLFAGSLERRQADESYNSLACGEWLFERNDFLRINIRVISSSVLCNISLSLRQIGFARSNEGIRH